MADEKMTKIKIRKQDRASGTHVDVGVNGLMEKVAVDQEVEVPEYILEALLNSSIAFDVVGGDGGVSSSSTAPLTNTATRAEPNISPLEGEKNEREVPVLGEGEGTGVGGAVQASLEPEAQLAAANADGQGANADGHDQTGGQTGPTEDKSKSPTEGTIDDLKAHIDTVSDKAELQSLLDEEKAGKNRAGAVAALEAAIAAE